MKSENEKTTLKRNKIMINISIVIIITVILLLLPRILLLILSLLLKIDSEPRPAFSCDQNVIVNKFETTDWDLYLSINGPRREKGAIPSYKYPTAFHFVTEKGLVSRLERTEHSSHEGLDYVKSDYEIEKIARDTFSNSCITDYYPVTKEDYFYCKVSQQNSYNIAFFPEIRFDDPDMKTYKIGFLMIYRADSGEIMYLSAFKLNEDYFFARHGNMYIRSFSVAEKEP